MVTAVKGMEVVDKAMEVVMETVAEAVKETVAVR